MGRSMNGYVPVTCSGVPCEAVLGGKAGLVCQMSRLLMSDIGSRDGLR